MNNEVLTPVAIKDAQAVPEEMVQTPPDLPPAAEPAVEAVAPAPAPTIAIPSLDDSSLYIHRELSQLQFNIRVLEQALDESYPLLERLKFLLIFSSNLDEFFEIRVAGLKKQITFAREQAGADGLQPHQAHVAVRVDQAAGQHLPQPGAAHQDCQQDRQRGAGRALPPADRACLEPLRSHRAVHARAAGGGTS